MINNKKIGNLYIYIGWKMEKNEKLQQKKKKLKKKYSRQSAKKNKDEQKKM